MKCVAFKGATAFEFQVGRYWMKILRPRFWAGAIRRPDLAQFIRVGIQDARS